jgi:uncharacterized membrane protein YphA (DoxX/SURF4 family)
VIRALCATVLLVAALSKGVVAATDGRDARTETMMSGLEARVPGVVYAVAGVEALAALWLLSGVATRSASVAVLVLISTFSGAVVFEMSSKNPRACGCFDVAPSGPRSPEAQRRGLALSLVRNLVLIVPLAWLAIDGRPGARGRQPGSYPAVPPASAG